MLSFLAGKAIKASVGAIAAAAGGVGTAAFTSLGDAASSMPAPADADLTLVGYIVVGALNGAVGFATVYFSPANK